MKKLLTCMISLLAITAMVTITSCASTQTTAEDSGATQEEWSENLLVNGNFEQGQGPNWSPWIDSGWGGAGEVKWENGMAILKIDEMGEQPWAVAMHYKYVTFEKGAKYKFKFDMKSDINRIVRVSIGNGLAPADPPYLEYQDIEIGPEWKTFEYEFTMKFRTNKFGRIDFNCAYNPGMFLPEGTPWTEEKLKATGNGTVYIDNVELQKWLAK